MAEYLFNSFVGADSMWQCCSAGVAAANGFPASAEAVQVMTEKDIDIRPHRSRALTAGLLDSAAMALVMAAPHAVAITKMFPDFADRVFLLKSFGGGDGNLDIADPIGLSVSVYRRTRDEIESALLDFIFFIKRKDKGC